MNPDVVVELAVGPICPPQSVLDELAEELSDNFLPTLGRNRRALAVCASREALGTNVVSMGIWGEPNGVSDDELTAALASQALLRPGRTAALLVTTLAIQTVTDAAWATTDKTLGRVTLRDTISVDVRPNEIVTTVRGTYDPPLLFIPNIAFIFEVTDRPSLRPPGSNPPLATQTSTDVDAGLPGVLGASLLIGMLSPILGVLVFFGSDYIAESQAPDSPGAGASLAAQWPGEVLTPIVPPFLPGKLLFAWSDLTVDESGVRTLGTFSVAEREPRVTIVGPRFVAIREALGHYEASYAAHFRDLRPPLTVRWGGAASGTGVGKRVFFHLPGHPRIFVNVQEDETDLSAEDEIAVTVTIIPLEPGQQRF
jgi:hypothetical protein